MLECLTSTDHSNGSLNGKGITNNLYQLLLSSKYIPDNSDTQYVSALPDNIVRKLFQKSF